MQLSTPPSGISFALKSGRLGALEPNPAATKLCYILSMPKLSLASTSMSFFVPLGAGATNLLFEKQWCHTQVSLTLLQCSAQNVDAGYPFQNTLSICLYLPIQQLRQVLFTTPVRICELSDSTSECLARASTFQSVTEDNQLKQKLLESPDWITRCPFCHQLVMKTFFQLHASDGEFCVKAVLATTVAGGVLRTSNRFSWYPGHPLDPFGASFSIRAVARDRNWLHGVGRQEESQRHVPLSIGKLSYIILWWNWDSLLTSLLEPGFFCVQIALRISCKVGIEE